MVVANPQATGRFKYWHAFLSFEGCEVLKILNPWPGEMTLLAKRLLYKHKDLSLILNLHLKTSN